jgi:hypothetical protein
MKCWRVYNNGDIVKKELTEAEKNEWYEYNNVFRFGCALLCDGKVLYTGYLSQERCEKIAATMFDKDQ